MPESSNDTTPAVTSKSTPSTSSVTKEPVSVTIPKDTLKKNELLLAWFIENFKDVVEREDIRLYFEKKIDAESARLGIAFNFPFVLIALVISALALALSQSALQGLFVVSEITLLIVFASLLSFLFYRDHNLQKKHADFFLHLLTAKRKLKIIEDSKKSNATSQTSVDLTSTVDSRDSNSG